MPLQIEYAPRDCARTAFALIDARVVTLRRALFAAIDIRFDAITFYRRCSIIDADFRFTSMILHFERYDKSYIRHFFRCRCYCFR